MTGAGSAYLITVSDGVHHGTRSDESGDALQAMLTEAGLRIAGRTVVPDERQAIAAAILAASGEADLVLTTGGTGFGPRDVTPEATSAVLERHAPGLIHLMLAAGIDSTPMAALSRPAAGSIGASLVVNLPGSPRGATENLSALLPVIPHALTLLGGDTDHQSEAPS